MNTQELNELAQELETFKIGMLYNTTLMQAILLTIIGANIDETTCQVNANEIAIQNLRNGVTA